MESAQLACLDLGAAVSTGEIARVEVFTQRCGYESLLYRLDGCVGGPPPLLYLRDLDAEMGSEKELKRVDGTRFAVQRPPLGTLAGAWYV